jgi:hypothetical protein
MGFATKTCRREFSRLGVNSECLFPQRSSAIFKAFPGAHHCGVEASYPERGVFAIRDRRDWEIGPDWGFFSSVREQRAMHRNARPTSVLVLAILNLILGGTGLVYSICGGLGLVLAALWLPTLPKTPGQPTQPGMFDAYQYVQQRVPSYYAFTGTSLGVSLAGQIVLLVSGVGLLKMRRWARTASLLYASVAVFMALVSLPYMMGLVNPAMAEFYGEAAKGPGMAIYSLFSDPMVLSVMTTLGSVVGLIYPVTLLIILNRPRIKAAFVPAALPADTPIRNEQRAAAGADTVDERIRPSGSGYK